MIFLGRMVDFEFHFTGDDGEEGLIGERDLNKCIWVVLMKILIKIILLLALPILLGFFLFYKTIPLNITEEGSNYSVDVPDFSELNENSGFGRMLRNVLSAPFDLKYYDIIVKDTSVYEGNPGNSGWIIEIDNKEFDFLVPNGKIKKTFLLDKPQQLKFVSKLKVERGNAHSGSMFEFKVSFEAYAKPNFWDIVAKIFLILVALNGIFLIGKDIYEFIIN